MFRSLFLTTALVGVTSAAAAQGAYVNGTYMPAGGSITLPAGSVTHDAQPMLGDVYDSAHSAGQTYETLGGQYEVYDPAQVIDQPYGDAPTEQTYTITPGNSQTYTVPAGQNATYNIVVPSAAPAVAYAQPEVYYAPEAAGWAARGVYVGARGGITSTRETDFDIAGLKGKPSNNIRTEYDDPGYTGSVVMGYGARQSGGWGYRVELEGGYQTTGVEAHTIRGVGKIAGSEAKGDAKTLYGFVNAYGDIPVSDRLSLTAGGGVGVGKVKFDSYGVGAQKALDDSATAFGYHLDAGVSYQLSEKIALEALYRYQSFVGAEVRTENGNDQKIDLDSHSVLAGVRVGF